MTTRVPNFYTINGVIDTSKSVLENMNLIAEASGCWMTYDIHQGKWAVVINNTGSSVASFNTSNILGSVNITSTSLTEVYNSVEMEFPHKDLTDEPDYVKMSITAGSRYPNEPDNILSMTSQLINNQAQAQSIAARQLKQNRIDKVITFQTDYSYIGLKAGELISVTLDIYAWTNKVFRITNISEEDADDGNILVSITALEYDASVYSTSGLEITPRNRQTGITAATLNSNIRTSDAGYYSNLVTTPTGIVNLVNDGNFVVTAGSFITDLIKIKKYVGTDYAFLSSFPTSGPDRYTLNRQITIPYTGTYSVEYIVNFVAAFDYDQQTGEIQGLPNTTRKRIRINITRNGVFTDTGSQSTTSIPRGSDPLADLSSYGEFTATEGDIIAFYLDCRQDLGTEGDTTFSNLPYCAVYVSATILFIGT